MVVPGCLVGGDDPNGGRTEAIEGDIQFEVIETHANFGAVSDPVIALRMATEEIYPCCNYSIVNDVHIESGTIDVDLLHIYMPSICLTALGPATHTEFLENAAGTYDLIFTNGSATDRFQLTVTDSSVQVTEEAAGFMQPLETLAWRRPVQSFACICGTTVETAWMCDAFIDSLDALPALAEFSFPDSGLIPYPDSSSGYYHNTPSRYFRYAAEADFDSAGAILARFTRDVIADQVGVNISITNWRNKGYLSWMLGGDPDQ